MKLTDRKFVVYFLCSLIGGIFSLSFGSVFLKLGHKPLLMQLLISLGMAVAFGFLTYFVGYRGVWKKIASETSKEKFYWFALSWLVGGLIALLSYLALSVPVVWHSLEINAIGDKNPASAGNTVRIIELRTDGEKRSFLYHAFKLSESWEIGSSGLTFHEGESASFEYKFADEKYKEIYLLLAAGPEMGIVEISLDGQTKVVDLYEEEVGGETIVMLEVENMGGRPLPVLPENEYLNLSLYSVNVFSLAFLLFAVSVLAFSDSFRLKLVQKVDAIVRSPLNALVIVYIIVILLNAWTCDDAYITFRTVDNFVNGYGLTYNVHERVQSFSNPLWTLFLSPFYFITRDVFYTSLAISVVLSVITIYIVTQKISISKIGSYLGMLLIGLSVAFVFYSTGGLENSLSHLLLVLFYWHYFSQPPSLKKLFVLSMIASFAALNRMDAGVFYLPALLYEFYIVKDWRGIFAGILGQIPLLLWMGFAVIYFGFPFPNTAYAKLNAGVPSIDYYIRGVMYLVFSLRNDLLTMVAIAASGVLGIYNKMKREIPIVLSILLYLLYIVKIGGDFMTGRFLAAPFLMAVIVLVRVDYSKLKQESLIYAFSLVIIIGLVFSDPTYKSIAKVTSFVPPRAHTHHFPTSGLVNVFRTTDLPDYYWRYSGADASILAEEKGFIVTDERNIGFYGFFAGPKVHVIDTLALSDALLARMPAEYEPLWLTGHLRRNIPEGYVESILSGTNEIVDEDISLFYDKLIVLTQDNFFEPGRIKTIWEMNTGKYDYLLQSE